METVLVGIATSLVSGILVYLASRRRNSGKVATSDAADLWAESNAMRKELRDEVASLRVEREKQADRIRELEIDKEKQADEMRELKNRVRDLEHEAENLRIEIRGLTRGTT